MGDGKVVDTNKPSVSVSNGIRTEEPKCDKLMEPAGSCAEFASQKAKITGGAESETPMEEKKEGEY